MSHKLVDYFVDSDYRAEDNFHGQVAVLTIRLATFGGSKHTGKTGPVVGRVPRTRRQW